MRWVSVVSSFFFFQAEDGIRAWSVTGVQTCALPIFFLFTFFRRVLTDLSDPPVPDPKDPSKLDEKMFKGKAMTYYGRWTYKYEIAAQRSEERRVGKEVRSRLGAEKRKEETGTVVRTG